FLVSLRSSRAGGTGADVGSFRYVATLNSSPYFIAERAAFLVKKPSNYRPSGVVSLWKWCRRKYLKMYAKQDGRGLNRLNYIFSDF
ncbi:hypothetical protein CRI63_21545, partial [Escherichia sp. E2661]